MEMISSGTEAVAKLAFNWTRQSQSTAMAFVLFTAKMVRSVFTVSKESQRLANQRHISACIVVFRRSEGRMEHRRHEFVPHTNAPHHHHGQWTDNVSENNFRKVERHYFAALV